MPQQLLAQAAVADVLRQDLRRGWGEVCVRDAGECVWGGLC